MFSSTGTLRSACLQLDALMSAGGIESKECPGRFHSLAVDRRATRWHDDGREGGELRNKMTPKLWQTGLLALGLIAACGGSSSRQDPGAQRPNLTGGTANATAGGNATAGSGAVPASGGVSSGAGGATGDAGSPDFGGASGEAGSQDSGGSAGNAGSQPFGGSAGAGGRPPLALPPGCQPRTPMETAQVCSLAVDCDTSPSVRTYCHRLDSGEWECQCANQEHLYRVENAAGLDACALAARLCSDDQIELGPESCEHVSDSSDQDGCAIDVACREPIAIDAMADVRAWRIRFGSVRCDRSDVAYPFGCTCANGATSSYGLLADSSELACGPFADFCMSGETPVFDGAEACSLMYATSDSEGCHRAAGCGMQMLLTDEVSLVQAKERYASCVARPGGGSECSCSDHDTAFVFYLSNPPDAASCESSIANCDPNAAIERTGPPNCESLSDDPATGDSCGAVLICVQPVTVDNRSIEARGSVNLLCRRAELGMAWFCSCASGQDTTRFELGAAGADASEACSQASTACLERMDLHIGPSGDTVQPPEPL
jgi:hypothetical protein